MTLPESFNKIKSMVTLAYSLAKTRSPESDPSASEAWCFPFLWSLVTRLSPLMSMCSSTNSCLIRTWRMCLSRNQSHSWQL